MATAADPVRPAARWPRRCGRWRRASWSCRGRCPPPGAARAARATCPARKSAAAPLLDELVSSVYLGLKLLQKLQLTHQARGSAVVVVLVDALRELVLQRLLVARDRFMQGVQRFCVLRARRVIQRLAQVELL